MLTTIEEKNKIKKALDKIKSRMKEYSERSGFITIGGVGWHKRRRVSWSSKLGIWWSTYSLHNRYENAFGVQEPKFGTKYPHDVTCVIDIPFRGINRRIGGAFAMDENGRIYLLHRGRIGGGRKGIGKFLFLQNFGGEWEKSQDGDAVTKLALIAALDSERFPHQLANFVYEIKRMKRNARMPIIETQSKFVVSPVFKEEFSGTKKYSLSKEIEQRCDHGLVANSLARELESEGLTIGKNAQMDVYILNENGEIETLFEVKTDATVESCYRAIGQLFFNSSKLSLKPCLIAVFPHTLNKEYRDVFDKLKIEVLTYRWIDNQPQFDSSFLSQLDLKNADGLERRLPKNL